MTATPAQQAIVDRLVDAAVAYFPGMSRAEVYTRQRNPRITACRAAVAYTLRKSGWSLEDIGAALQRDHTTVHYLVAQYEAGRYATPPLPSTVAPPRDFDALTARILELESRLATVESALAAVERSFVRRSA